MKILISVLLLMLLVPVLSIAQTDANYDETKVPEFKLPDPLHTFSGKKVRSIKQWEKKRRPELLHFFTENVYGAVPGELKIQDINVIEESTNALEGKAHRKQIVLSFARNNHRLEYTILVYLPNNVEKAPLFLAYDFLGNHTITKDPEVIISEAWVADNPSLGIINNQLTEQSRGVRCDRWALDKILDAGYGLAVIYYGEVDPDKNDMTDGVHPFFYVDDQEQPADNEWGSIAAWAWGLSRALDYFEQDADIDASKVIVFGHSRLGKTSLWAGATDERFAGVISNDSGCGGAALSKRRFGETIARINRSFPHWFCNNFKNYNNNEQALPVDQHELIALIAPRPVYVASAVEDRWADPKGEFLSALDATPVFELYDKKGVQQQEMPDVNQPIMNTVSYHIRTGGHGVTDYDWEQYIRWADEYVK